MRELGRVALVLATQPARDSRSLSGGCDGSGDGRSHITVEDTRDDVVRRELLGLHDGGAVAAAGLGPGLA